MPEQFAFAAEIKQLLDIVVHSLYTEKEIFIRELISNASDALERLRHLQLTERDVHDAERPLEIHIITDRATKSLVIADSGVGMTGDELVQNLGTIAYSGSRALLTSLSETDVKPASLIGQFGVGFYSAFMAAERIQVFSRSWRMADGGHVWSSDGVGTYEVGEADVPERGTRIVMTLKDDCADFASDWKVREILERYSAFVAFPINLNGSRINVVDALWLRPKNVVSDTEYADFYKFQAHAYDEPRLRLHFQADAPLSINALLFVPSTNPERLGMARAESSVALYCRRVLIDGRPKDLLPNWLRFLRGVVDSEDLPLNVSREMMQDRSLVAKLKNVITHRFLRFLEEEANARPQSYEAFYAEFGQYLKEGAAVDHTQREPLSKLLRYESSATAPGQVTDFAAYVSRMKVEQKDIYYLIGPNRTVIEQGPYFEGLKARELEVLYCYSPVDEYVMSNIGKFDDKSIVAADHIDLTLPEADKVAGAEASELTGEDAMSLQKWLQETLDSRVTEIKVSSRLVSHPALAVSSDRLTSPHLRRMMRSMNREGTESPIRVTLEINPNHPVMKRLSLLQTANPDVAALVAKQVLDNALLGAGLLEDPVTMVPRLNRLLEYV